MIPIVRDWNYIAQVLKGMFLTILSASFAVIGIITAAQVSILAGSLILVSSLAFWGYACLFSDVVEGQAIEGT